MKIFSYLKFLQHLLHFFDETGGITVVIIDKSETSTLRMLIQNVHWYLREIKIPEGTDWIIYSTSGILLEI